MGYVGVTDSRTTPSFVRGGELLQGRLEETVVPSDTMLLASGWTGQGFVDVGFQVPDTAGNHLNESKMRSFVSAWSKTATLSLQAVTAMGFDNDDPAWVVQANLGTLTCLCTNGLVYSFPGLLGPDWEPGSLYSISVLERLFQQYDFSRDHPSLAANQAAGLDWFLCFTPSPLALIRYGRIDMARSGIKLLLEAATAWQTNGFDFVLDKMLYDVYFQATVPPVDVAAGLRPQLLEQVHVRQVGFAQVDDSEWDGLFRAAVEWPRVENSVGAFTFFCRDALVGAHKLRHFYFAPEEVGHDVALAWLDGIPPGEACSARHGADGSYDLSSSGWHCCVVNSVSPALDHGCRLQLNSAAAANFQNVVRTRSLLGSLMLPYTIGGPVQTLPLKLIQHRALRM